MASKPFFSIPTPPEGPGEKDSHKIWKETLLNVVSTGNKAPRMIFQNTEENNASFVI